MYTALSPGASRQRNIVHSAPEIPRALSARPLAPSLAPSLLFRSSEVCTKGEGLNEQVSMPEGDESLLYSPIAIRYTEDMSVIE